MCTEAINRWACTIHALGTLTRLDAAWLDILACSEMVNTRLVYGTVASQNPRTVACGSIPLVSKLIYKKRDVLNSQKKSDVLWN